MYYSDNDFRLYHHQVKGAHWYVKNGPPYPLDRAISTGKRLKEAAVNKVRETAGKIKEHQAKQAEAKAAKKAEAEKKRIAEEAEKKRQAEEAEKKRVAEEKAKHEAEKQDAIKSGDATKVDRFKNEMSLQELNEAVQRVNLNRQIASSMPKEVSKFDKAISAMDKTKTVIDKGVGYWNSFAKIYNSFNEEPLPVIDGNLQNRIAEKNKKDREAEIYRSLRNTSGNKDAFDKALRSMSNDEVAALNKRLNNEKNIRSFSWDTLVNESAKDFNGDTTKTKKK